MTHRAKARPTGAPAPVERSAPGRRRRAAFTLVELLVVVAVVALLVAILAPSLAAAREHAKVVRALAELRGIATAIQMYTASGEQDAPPARTWCASGRADHWCELPRELVASRCLPAAGDADLSAGMEDAFNPGRTYKYLAPGWGYHNDAAAPKAVWVPDAFGQDDPDADPRALRGRAYDNVSMPLDADGRVVPSPVAWVVWSLGPRYDPTVGSGQRAPVARCTWYRGTGTRGVIPILAAAGGQLTVWKR